MACDWTRVLVKSPTGRVRRLAKWGRSRRDSERLADQEFWLVTAGAGWMETREKRMPLGPGFVAWMRPGGIYDAGQEEEHPLSIVYIHFDMLDRRGRVMDAAGSAPGREFWRARDLAYVEAVAGRVVDLFVAGTERSQWAAGQLLSGLLADVMGWEETREQGLELHERILLMAEEMRAHPERGVKVEALARRAGVTSAHFSRTFRWMMGVSPQMYAIESRLRQAKHLLVESSMSVGEVASSLGYTDVAFFSRQFHQFVGVSPSRLREGKG